MSLLCQLWTLNETIQALKEQRTRQNNSVSPVPEGDSEDGGGGGGGEVIMEEEDGAPAWEELDDEDLGENGSPSGKNKNICKNRKKLHRIIVLLAQKSRCN